MRGKERKGEKVSELDERVERVLKLDATHHLDSKS